MFQLAIIFIYLFVNKKEQMSLVALFPLLIILNYFFYRAMNGDCSNVRRQIIYKIDDVSLSNFQQVATLVAHNLRSIASL